MDFKIKALHEELKGLTQVLEDKTIEVFDIHSKYAHSQSSLENSMVL